MTANETPGFRPLSWKEQANKEAAYFIPKVTRDILRWLISLFQSLVRFIIELFWDALGKSR